MTTVFLNIGNIIVSELQVDPAVCAQVHRAFGRNIPSEWAQMVNVEYEGSSPEEGSIQGAPIDWTSQYAIECYAKSTTQQGDEAVDDVVRKVFERMRLDTTLGGKVRHVGVPVISTEFDALGQKTGWVRMMFPITHRTSGNKLD